MRVTIVHLLTSFERLQQAEFRHLTSEPGRLCLGCVVEINCQFTLVVWYGRNIMHPVFT